MQDEIKTEPLVKRVKLEDEKGSIQGLKTVPDVVETLLPNPLSHATSAATRQHQYKDAVITHPFYDSSHAVLDVYSDAIFRDANGTIVGMLFRNALPERAATDAANVLRAAAQKTSLRSTIYGGEAPNSGIAGYFDYRGSPITYKSRKTSFTYSHKEEWPRIFPMIDYVNDMYRRYMPENWAAQNACIPDVVRINGSVFSTLTINSRFRTAHHTDVGDFDGGYSCICCLEGQYKGLALSFDQHKISFFMRPRDLVIFNPHHFHSNTELEELNDNGIESDWSRLTCVFYYRAQLGEPWSYAEYQRRLDAALKSKMSPLPVVREIVVKPNGAHLNRPSPVFTETYTPFFLPCAVRRLRRCNAKALRVHHLLLRKDNAGLVERLFGEALSCEDGIPMRSLSEKVPAVSAIPTYNLGGFSEQFLNTAEKGGKLFVDEVLGQMISEELHQMWIAGLDKFMNLLVQSWEVQLETNPSRTNFTWNNKGEMNSAFFELCDVAKEVMYAVMQSESVPSAREQQFWATYASHLNTLSVSRLKMPSEALSLKKLNVKLKDYQFGGTRYFKDMPPEEQQRRLERRQRIEWARKNGTIHNGAERSDWLENDRFDYQTENQAGEVDYAALGLPLPHENTDRFADAFTDKTVPPADAMGPIRLLVVLPRGSSVGAPQPSVLQAMIRTLLPSNVPAAVVGTTARTTTQQQRKGKSKKEKEEEEGEGEGCPVDLGTPGEFARLLGNAAAQRLIATCPTRVYLSLPEPFTCDNLHVQFAFADDPLPSETKVDFVVLQHVLCGMDDTAARAYVQQVSGIAEGCVLVVETDLFCRNYYTILPALRKAYMEAAPVAFTTLHTARYAASSKHLRSRVALESVLPTFAGRFKFDGSPLNSVLYIVPGRCDLPLEEN